MCPVKELTSLPSSSPSLKLVIAINMRGCSPCCCLLAMPIKIKTQWIPVNTYPLSVLGRIGDYRGWLRQGCRKRGEMPSNALVLFVFVFAFLNSGPYSPSSPPQIRSTYKVPAGSQDPCILLPPCSHVMELSRERAGFIQRQWTVSSQKPSIQSPAKNRHVCERDFSKRKCIFYVQLKIQWGNTP